MRMNQKNLVVRIITTPYKALCKAKNFYIRSITDCANPTTNYGMAAAAAMSRTTSVSSFGSSSAAASDDLRELIRANSTASTGDMDVTRADLEMYIKQHMMTRQSSLSAQANKGSRRVPRSVSVGMGRIDEEGPVSSFSDDQVDSGRKVKSERLMFPRSRSHVVSSGNKFNRFS
ncbi:hypothetical protein SSX86_015078 [Deinandra increscens subsp. villosa]|uniref:Uncharacterized protein n=1 Tax=Deinandra increscens subsp. villosa TaxID=3103831 RepID=A0AAP0D3R7_9ASTR